jgi:hypothetical protein
LSEVCGHDIWNINVGSIGNLGEFANKSPLAPLYQEGKLDNPSVLRTAPLTGSKITSLSGEGDYEVVERLSKILE